MKLIFTISSLFLVLRASLADRTQDRILGDWTCHVIVLNADTIFYRNDINYSLDWNYKKSAHGHDHEIDSVRIKEATSNNFESLKQMRLSFKTDGEFEMTHIRSVGKINPLLKDEGTYDVREDSIFVSLIDRRERKMFFLYDNFAHKIFSYDGLPGHMVFTEYVKLDTD
jgi:hypothetical protein